MSDTVSSFFDRYATALMEVDLDTLAECYNYPSLAVSPMGCLAIPNAEMTREFFHGNAEQYRELGVMGVRIANLRPSHADDGVWIGLADLENLDADGNVVGVELNAYQLVHRGDAGWAIAVSTPLTLPVEQESSPLGGPVI